MAKIEIKEGYLYEDDVKIVPEFGNMEQIKVIRKYEKKMLEFSRGGLQLEPSFEYDVTARVGFTCLCGSFIIVETKSDKKENTSGFDDVKTKCSYCKKNYILNVPSDYEILVTFDSKTK